MATDSAEVLQRIYDSEINFAIHTCWQDGFDWKLFDSDMDPVASGSADSLTEAAVALAEAIMSAFPHSDFAVWWGACRSRGPLPPSLRDPCPLCGIPVMAMANHGEIWRIEHTEGGPCRARRGLQRWERLPIAAIS